MDLRFKVVIWAAAALVLVFALFHSGIRETRFWLSFSLGAVVILPAARRLPLSAAFGAAVLACGLTGVHAGAEPVGSVGRHYVDEHRRNWDQNGPRPLETTVWYPASLPVVGQPPVAQPANLPFEVSPALPDAPLAAQRDQYPLILISHGTGGCALNVEWLGHYFAERGYIVAAVNHHGNTCGEAKADPRGYMLSWERPQDLSAVLDRLLDDAMFGPHIDRQKIGAAGFSLGGYTVIALAGGRLDRRRFDRFCASPARDFTCGPQPEFPEAPAQLQAFEASDPVVRDALKHSGDSYRDPRVRAVFAMAPVLGGGFARKDLADIDIPVEIVVGEGDTTAPRKTNAERYAALIRGAQLVELPGQVGHYDFMPVCTDAGVELFAKINAQRLCHDVPGADRRQVHETVDALALKFFDRSLAGRP
jgi:predicted dienelactone hydrolase